MPLPPCVSSTRSPAPAESTYSRLVDTIPRRVLEATPPVVALGPDVAADIDRYRTWQHAAEARHRHHGPSVAGNADTRGAGRALSVVVVIAEPLPTFVAQLVASVVDQSETHWELCAAVVGAIDVDTDKALDLAGGRVRRIDCPATTETADAAARALALSGGTAVTFIGQHDVISPGALGAMLDALDAGADVAYCDEDTIDAAGNLTGPRLKPAWSPDLMDSTDYVGALTVLRHSLVREAGGVRSHHGDAWEYDLKLRACERATTIVHVPDVLFHRRASAPTTSPSAPAESGARAVEAVVRDALARRGEQGFVQPAHVAGAWHVRRTLASAPLVSAIICFRDSPRLLRTCLDSLSATAEYANIEWLLVDNDSEEPETSALVERLAERPGVRVLQHPGAFNWAAINNAAARQARGDVLLFLNNDIEARSSDWMAPLVEHAQRSQVGAVGGRLLYPTGEVQHVGVVLGMGGAAGHVLRGLEGDRPGYLGLAAVTRNCSAVTGACLMTRRSVFDELGGFDETFALDLNDIDYCLRLRQRGLDVVCTPLCELVHHESPSRGSSGTPRDILAFVERWEDAVVAGDPYLNPNLTRLDSSCSLRHEGEREAWIHWKSILEESLTP
jgi:O-antigen biosynthesis protein